MNKIELRKFSKELRKKFDTAEISGMIISKIENSEEFQRSQNVLLFYPKEYEINVIELCAKYEKEKNFYLPKVVGKNLAVCPYDCSVDTEISEFNIKEPCTLPVNPEIIDYAVIPCLCADKRGYRTGYGGGFYDRFLPLLTKNCIKVVPVASSLLFDKVPNEPHDVPADFVITEKEIINCKNYC